MFGNSQAFNSFSVDNLGKAKQFYAETLGVKVTEDFGVLMLHLSGDRPTMLYPKDDHQPATFTVLNFSVDDIESAVEQLKQRGVQFEHYEGTAVETDEDGIFRKEGPPIAWFKDPAGNVLAVIKTQ